MKKVIRLNESDIKKIIKKVIIEVSYDNLKQKGGCVISREYLVNMAIGTVVWEASNYEESYDRLGYDPIPEYVKPYLDDIVDAVQNKMDLSTVAFQAMSDTIERSKDIEDIVDRIKMDLGYDDDEDDWEDDDWDDDEEEIDEDWSEKYKKSIDCNNPKGFSQKAHCQGRKKKD